MKAPILTVLVSLVSYTDFSSHYQYNIVILIINWSKYQTTIGQKGLNFFRP